MICQRLLIVGLICLAVTLQARADELTGRLKRIKENAIIVIGHAETTMPFSYLDGGMPVGFGVDISRRVAEAVKKRVGLNELRVRWNPATLSTRFPLMITNAVDLECTTTTHNKAREAMVSFSNTFYISDDAIAVRHDSPIKEVADLTGKRIAVAQRTTTEAWLIAKGLGANILPQRSNRIAMAALANGEADAFVGGAPIIAGQLLRFPNAGAYRIITIGDTHEAFACMLPMGDIAFKRVVDETLAEMMKSGEMEQLYNKWFMQPIPPLGRSANLPFNEDNRKLYQQPNDTPFD